MATLLAEPAEPLLAAMQVGAPQPQPGTFISGVPADLLRNRPDVRAAERELAAAVAAVGVAEAVLYPSISLNGNMTASDPQSWSFGPALSLPLLNHPVLAASRDAATARVTQSELAWRRAVLAAVEEVQSAQSALMRGQRTLCARQEAAESYSRLVELTRATFEGGTSTLLDLLDAERSRANARAAVASAQRDVAASWLSLQIATGRGWAAH